MQGGVSQLGGVHPRTVKNNDDGTFCLKELELKVNLFLIFSSHQFLYLYK